MPGGSAKVVWRTFAEIHPAVLLRKTKLRGSVSALTRRKALQTFAKNFLIVCSQKLSLSITCTNDFHINYERALFFRCPYLNDLQLFEYPFLVAKNQV